MRKETRKIRTYRATDPIYKKAGNRAKKQKHKLSTLINGFIIAYGNGKSSFTIDELINQ